MNCVRALILLIAVMLAGSVAEADAPRPIVIIKSKSTTQAANFTVTVVHEQVVNPSSGDVQEVVPPEQAVVIDLHRPWLDGSGMDSNTPPVVFGVDKTLPQPRFTVVDPNRMGLWFYRLALPIDVTKYPIISMKYRAQNTSKDAAYVLRLVFQQGDIRSRGNAWSGADLIPDGQEHELQLDWRTMKAGGNQLINFGLAVKTDDKPATFDLLELKFSAASDSSNEKLKDDLPVHLRVVDDAGNPLPDAKVIVDAERANFARAGHTDKDGMVSVTPLINDADKHMVRVEKSGYLTIEVPQTSTESGQAPDIKMMPAVNYGGIAKGADGVVAANARVAVLLNPGALNGLPMRIETNVVSDGTGHWQSPLLPADASKLRIELHQRDPSGKETSSRLDPAQYQLSKAIAVADVSGEKSSATKATSGTVASAKSQAAKGPPPLTVIVEKVDESTTAVGLTGIDHDQLQIVRHPEPGKDENGTMAMMDTTEVMFKKAGEYSSSSLSTPTSRPTDRLAGCRVTMAGEDQINGDIVGWTEKRITIRPNVAPTITMDLAASQVREIWCGTDDQVKKAQALKEQNSTDDVVFVAKDADVVAVHGIATGIQGSDLHFLYNDQDRKIALNRVVGLVLAKPSEAEVQQSDAFYQTVQFVTGEQISGHVTGYDGKHLTVAMLGSGQEAQLPVDELAKISMRNGRVVYLSDMKPSKVEQTPFFDRLMPYRMDHSLTGKPIVLLDGSYPKGISVHSRCVLTFDIGGKFDEFRTKVGFALPEGKIGEAAIRVIGDGKILWEKADAHGDQMPDDLKLKVGGVHELTLEVDFGKNDDTGDRVSWANARLIRAAVGK